jgi:hypothetical protein
LQYLSKVRGTTVVDLRIFLSGFGLHGLWKEFGFSQWTR